MEAGLFGEEVTYHNHRDPPIFAGKISWTKLMNCCHGQKSRARQVTEPQACGSIRMKNKKRLLKCLK